MTDMSADSVTDATVAESNPYPGGARLNSEGYIVSAASVRGVGSLNMTTAAGTAGGAGSYANTANGGNQGATIQGANGTTQSEIIKAGDNPIVTTEQMIYMVKNHMDLTIENLDIAKNSVNEESPFITSAH